MALGVHPRTTNIALYGETGRYPILIDQSIAAVKYQHRLEFSCENRLLNKFYDNLKNKEQALIKGSLVGFCENVNDTLGLSKPHTQKSTLRCTRQIRSKLCGRFQEYWHRSINVDHSKLGGKGNKLRTYKTFKTVFKEETYLTIANFEMRRKLAQFRLSAHKLAIETGRYNGKNRYVLPENRLCQSCNGHKMEDEQHFLMECHKYKPLREVLFRAVSDRNPHFTQYNQHQKFVWLMLNEDIDALKSTAYFITKAFEVRG